MTDTAVALPHWDMTVVFPNLESPEFQHAYEQAIQEISDLTDLFDAHQIGQQPAGAPTPEVVATAEAIIRRFNGALEGFQILGSYVEEYVATDSRNDLAQAKLSELEGQGVRLWQFGTRLTAWVGSLDVEALIAASPLAGDHAYWLRHAHAEAEHLMSPAEEALAAELHLAAGAAWGKLHSNLTSQLMVPVELDGEIQHLPMSAVRNLAYEADRDLRRRGYEAELRTWPEAALPLAAAINSIKAETNTLTARRGWETPLAAALFDNHIDRQTLDAMLDAAREALPDFRRYLKTKARALGLPALAWYDLFAPVGESGRVWTWPEAEEFIVTQFGAYSDRLARFAARAFRERWIDAEPRPGKSDGGFCMPLWKDESRVLVNYTPAYDGVSTLAHELGHAYHNLNEARRTMLQRGTPMTLAETASIFCETIVREAALTRADRAEQLYILEASLQAACQTVVDILSRFLFEQRLFAKRRERELSTDELNALMLDAQRETYGDGLDPDVLHPYMWAVKGHYYSTGGQFYNYPYMFGLLFGLGLYARYRQDPEAFKAGYDDLLASTGMADAATLAARFGIDIATPAFWRASFDLLRADIDRFEALVDQ